MAPGFVLPGLNPACAVILGKLRNLCFLTMESNSIHLRRYSKIIQVKQLYFFNCIFLKDK